jgi:hypothetical protein
MFWCEIAMNTFPFEFNYRDDNAPGNTLPVLEIANLLKSEV